MQQIFMEIVNNLLVILVTTGVGFAVALLRKRLGIEGINKVQAELSAKQDLVEMAIHMVQQVYKDYNGEQKYTLAATYVSQMASAKGLKISEDEVKGLIESTLKQIKTTFGEEWKKSQQ